MGFSGSWDGKESNYNVGDLALIPGLGRLPGEVNSYPLQYSCLENSMDRGAWQAKRQTLLSDFHFTTLKETDSSKKTSKTNFIW